LRLHEGKNFANVILPFSSKGDEDSKNNFLKVMAKNDSRLRKSYEEKKLGGYISISKVEYEDKIKDDEKEDDDEDIEDIEDIEDNEIELKCNMIFDSMGKMKNNEDLWMIRFDEVKKYIDENGKTPSKRDKNKYIKILASWISNQKTNFKNIQLIMKNENFYKLWNEFITSEKYKIYFLSQEELFNLNFDNLIEYIYINNELPSQYDENKIIKTLGRWVGTNKKNYKNNFCNMKNKVIWNKWHNFINNKKYKVYFQLPTSEELFIKNLKNLKHYINIYKKLPSHSHKNREYKLLAGWYSNQKQNYKNNDNNMIIEYIYTEWEKFINDDKYKKYLKVPEMEELFDNNLRKLQEYIDKSTNACIHKCMNT
jgi:hypothetical protein